MDAAGEGRPSLRDTRDRAGNGTADGDYDWAAARPPAAASTSSGGRAVPDALAEALALNPAQRACMDIARDISVEFPGWDVGWGLQGYAAGRADPGTGDWDIVRSDSPSGLRAMLEAKKLPPGDGAP